MCSAAFSLRLFLTVAHYTSLVPLGLSVLKTLMALDQPGEYRVESVD